MTRILICPDSFKGGPDAPEVAEAIAAGWRRHRRHDLDLCPLADGGEGTAAVIAAAVPGSTTVEVPGCTGPDGSPRTGTWLRLPDGTGVVELAQIAGLPLLDAPAPLTATTAGVGELLRSATLAGAERLLVALGGSASTDGGAGALVALGLDVLDATGTPVPPGGVGLSRARSVRRDSLLSPPPGGVEILVDVRAPLHGPHGAALVYAPQKGASSEQVLELDAALEHWSTLLGGDITARGAGAAGGTAYGLAACWDATLRSGAAAVADLVDLDSRIAAADLIITGEGRYDATSADGKVVGEVQRRAARHGVPVCVIAGAVAAEAEGTATSLTVLAGSAQESLRRPVHWLGEAAAALARDFS